MIRSSMKSCLQKLHPALVNDPRKFGDPIKPGSLKIRNLPNPIEIRVAEVSPVKYGETEAGTLLKSRLGKVRTLWEPRSFEVGVIEEPRSMKGHVPREKDFLDVGGPEFSMTECYVPNRFILAQTPCKGETIGKPYP